MNPKQTEADFLARELQRTQAEMRHTLDELQKSCKTAADVRLWTQNYPWTAMGLAAATGFAAAAVVTPARGERLKDHFAHLASHFQKDAQETETVHSDPAKVAEHGWLSMLMGPLIGMITSLAQTYVMSILHPQAQAPPEQNQSPPEPPVAEPSHID